MDYTNAEIRGKHHSIFVDIDQKNSAEYKNFWKTFPLGSHYTAFSPVK